MTLRGTNHVSTFQFDSRMGLRQLRVAQQRKQRKTFVKKRASIITEIAKLLYLLQRLPIHRSDRTLCQNVRKLITRPHVIDQIGLVLVHSFKHPIQMNAVCSSKETQEQLITQFKMRQSKSTLRVCVCVCLCHMPQIAPIGGITAELFKNCGVGLSAKTLSGFFYRTSSIDFKNRCLTSK